MKPAVSVLGAFHVLLALISAAWIGVGLFSLRYVFAVVVPYFAVGAFTIGIVYRVLRWATSPVPFHIPTVCGQQKSLPWIKPNRVDSPSGAPGVIARMALEILLFRSLFRNERVKIGQGRKIAYGGNRFLWLGGLVFHWSLFVILFRHLRLFTEPVPAVVLLVRNLDGILQPTFPFVFISDFAILAGLTYLFLRRVVFPQLRYISLLSDYLALFLLLGIVLSGMLMRFFFRENIVAVKELAMGVLAFHPSVPPDLGLIFYVHFFLVCVLIAYFPVSKLMHGPGLFLSPTLNLANLSRARRRVNPWNYPVKVHTYAEYEDEFRVKMRQAGLPLEKD